MKKITIKKMYKGYVAVKSTIIDECILNKEGLIITYNKKKMTIALENLGKHAQLSNQIYHSSSDGKSYKLFDYLFVEDKKEKK
jgi:hypothetical protein